MLTIVAPAGTMSTTLDIRDCGLADYRSILQFQHELRDRRRAGDIPDTVLLVEHPPVITLGARRSANTLLADERQLEQQSIDVVQIRRGGGTTVHNPGQIVFYPIFDLSDRNLGINPYVRTLETIGIELLATLGVVAERAQGYPGLWVRPIEPRTSKTPDNAKVSEAPSPPSEARNTKYEIRNTKKIASIGVRVSRFVTCHGMAINISNDLSLFELIVPCGLDGVAMTSVTQEIGRAPDMAEVKNTLTGILKNHFA